jgi:UDP-N-acetylglucosamine 4,6-dehydratase
VVHAAAMKIIPTCERDPFECIHTNIIGAENVARAALRAGVKKVIALSTDKAAAPLNLYGATKLAAEKLFVAANNIAAGVTRYSCVRYGNVVGSRGSVIPLFRQLASEGKPLPLTHPAMTRFWITLDQAVDFVLSSLDRMQGREIFVPKLPSMKILDLALAINRASGFVPLPPKGWQYPVIGIRPGEKLHETLITEDEARITFDLDDRYVITDRTDITKRVPKAFVYRSNANDRWLTVGELQEMIA